MTGADGAEALIERRGAAGVIVLNRPRALNALTLAMVRLMAGALDAWEQDPAVTRIVIRGAGEKAFCAGGDIRQLYEFGRAGDHAAQLDFWREEYQLNARIRAYPKPIVALIDGIVMGGESGFDQCFASGRGRSVPVRHARGRDRIFSRCRGDLYPAATAAPGRELFRADRASRKGGRCNRVRPRPDLCAERRFSGRWPRRWSRWVLSRPSCSGSPRHPRRRL